jgi:hypothetical protein
MSPVKLFQLVDKNVRAERPPNWVGSDELNLLLLISNRSKDGGTADPENAPVKRLLFNSRFVKRERLCSFGRDPLKRLR